MFGASSRRFCLGTTVVLLFRAKGDSFLVIRSPQVQAYWKRHYVGSCTADEPPALCSIMYWPLLVYFLPCIKFAKMLLSGGSAPLSGTEEPGVRVQGRPRRSVPSHLTPYLTYHCSQYITRLTVRGYSGLNASSGESRNYHPPSTLLQIPWVDIQQLHQLLLIVIIARWNLEVRKTSKIWMKNIIFIYDYFKPYGNTSI